MKCQDKNGFIFIRYQRQVHNCNKEVLVTSDIRCIQIFLIPRMQFSESGKQTDRSCTWKLKASVSVSAVGYPGTTTTCTIFLQFISCNSLFALLPAHSTYLLNLALLFRSPVVLIIFICIHCQKKYSISLPPIKDKMPMMLMGKYAWRPQLINYLYH